VWDKNYFIGGCVMVFYVGNYEIYSDSKNVKIYENVKGINKEFKNSLFIEVDGKIDEIPADGRFYTIKGCYVKIKKIK
jgi:hypothetical protein